MEKNISRQIIPYILTLSMILSGCGEKSECELPSRHVHKYTKQISDDISIERYMDDERLKVYGYNWNQEYIEINKHDEERIKILDQTRNEVISRAIIERDQSLSSISVSLAERYRESIQAEIERLRKELDDGKTLAENELVRLKNLQEVDLKKLTHSPSDYKMKKEMYENT